MTLKSVMSAALSEEGDEEGREVRLARPKKDWKEP